MLDLLWQEPRPTKIASPLPGGIAAVVRFFFGVPQWIQIAGFILGVIVAVLVVLYLWRRRSPIWLWVSTRRRQIKVAMAVAVVLVVAGFTAFGAVGWHYMQHDNGFCTGCHVMAPAYQRFTQSEHDTLQCHQCHQQSIFASAKQLYFWVAERPQSIPPHAKVPNRICASCHVTGEGKKLWQRIATTAGHRTHLESDSAVLRNIQCVRCHGVEVHHFAPVDSTCAQAHCHINNTIELGKMAQQTSLHCTACHAFKADVPPFVTRDSARGTLVPGNKECLGCHEMRQVLASFDPANDPHRGTCGMCHNPHTQHTPAEAKQSCTNSQCHADWRKVPFHVGPAHRRLGGECITCHVPHAARVDASDCAGCHAAVKARRAGRLNPPMPFDTAAALRRVSLDLHHPFPAKGKGDAPFVDDPPMARAPSTPADSFPHSRHKSLTCITCHLPTRVRGKLVFEQPRGCQICHHQAAATSDCATCHAKTDLTTPESVTVRVRVANAPERSHPVTFDHGVHKNVKCVDCHTSPVTLEPGADVLRCAACHDDHHAAARSCVACHNGSGPELRVAHAPPTAAHESCDACHQPEIVGRLVPDRRLCVTCHLKQQDHYATQECAVCHFQAAPAQYQAHLRRAGAGS
jgi:nitrate/TMAO reductase-like tetraheme cytochrome c subunit